MMNRNFKMTLPNALRVAVVLTFLLLSSLVLAQRRPSTSSSPTATSSTAPAPLGTPETSASATDKIAAIGNLSAAPRKRTIDAAGKVVAPGFIDMLGQSELTILVDPRLPSKIFQGITSEITGEGNSVAPLNDAIIQSDHSRIRLLQDHARLAHLPPIFRAPRKARHGHQPRELCWRHASPPHGPRR